MKTRVENRRLGRTTLEERVHLGPAWEHWRATGDDGAVYHVATPAFSTASIPGFAAAFARAVEERGALSHPRVPALLFAGRDPEDAPDVLAQHYIVFDHVDGVSLEEARSVSRSARSMPVDVALAIVRDVARVASTLPPSTPLPIHPESILVDRGGATWVTAMPKIPRPTIVGPLPSPFFAYLSPEAISGRAPGPASTVFCLGTLLADLVLGKNPFLRTTGLETLEAVRKVDAPDLSLMDLPFEVIRLVERALRRVGPPIDTATGFRAEIDALVHGQASAAVAKWIGDVYYGARDVELERSILAEVEKDPDGVEPYLVYADYLQSSAEVRGELIMLQSEAARAPEASTRRRLRRTQSSMIRTHADVLLGPLARWFDWVGPRASGLIDGGPHYIGRTTTGPMAACWHMGFIRSLRIGIDREWWPIDSELMLALATLSDAESSRLLRDLTIGRVAEPLGHFDYAPIYRSLHAVQLPIRSLFVGDLGRGTPRGHHAGIETLSSTFPDLIRLAIRGQTIALPRLQLGRLRELRVYESWVGHTIESIGDSRLPELRYLELGFGLDLEPIEAIGALDRLPKLEGLALVVPNEHLSARLIGSLASASLAANLKDLSLAKSSLGHEGGRALLEHLDAFRSLARLDLRGAAIPGAIAAELRARVPCLEV
jgi:uncharacterized protein (TIGR02996 family)